MKNTWLIMNLVLFAVFLIVALALMSLGLYHDAYLNDKVKTCLMYFGSIIFFCAALFAADLIAQANNSENKK